MLHHCSQSMTVHLAPRTCRRSSSPRGGSSGERYVLTAVDLIARRATRPSRDRQLEMAPADLDVVPSSALRIPRRARDGHSGEHVLHKSFQAAGLPAARLSPAAQRAGRPVVPGTPAVPAPCRCPVVPRPSPRPPRALLGAEDRSRDLRTALSWILNLLQQHQGVWLTRTRRTGPCPSVAGHLFAHGCWPRGQEKFTFGLKCRYRRHIGVTVSSFVVL